MKKQVLLVSALTLLSLPSFASNFYASGNIGQSEYKLDGLSGSESDTTFSLGGGYKFNDNWAIEVNFRDLGAFGFSYREDFGGGDYVSESLEFSHSTLEASVVGSYPINETTSIYGRLGFGDLEVDIDYKYSERFEGEPFSASESASESKNKTMFGFGLRHNLNESVGVRAEYNLYDEWEGVEISFATVGLVYQF